LVEDIRSRSAFEARALLGEFLVELGAGRAGLVARLFERFKLGGALIELCFDLGAPPWY
jgi:hypothetical protein